MGRAVGRVAHGVAHSVANSGATASRTLLPTAHAMLTFFDLHYTTDATGQYVMEPSQALETWWDTTGPMPQIAGLRALGARLLRLSAERTPPAERELWQRVARRTPELPTWVARPVVVSST